MGSQTHTPGAGLRPGSLGKRNLPAILEMRRQLEADLRPAVYVRPLGGGIHLVKNANNPQTYRVGSAAGTDFTPGQGVLLGSHTGAPGEVIVAQPPLGQKGASAVAPQRVIRPPKFQLDAAAGDYYAFTANGEFVASIYRGTEWLEDRGSVATFAGFFDACQLIRTDSASIVGDGSLLSIGGLETWDVEGDVVYSYSVPSGWFASGGIYDDGWVWWMEVEEIPHGSIGAQLTFFRLRRARGDFSAAETVGTFEADHVDDLGFGLQDVLVDPDLIRGLTLAGAGGGFAGFTFQDNVNQEGGEGATIRMTRAGVGSVASASKGTYGLPATTGLAIIPPGEIGVGSDIGLASVPDDLGTAPAELWPLTEPWIGVNPYVTADGAEATLYGPPNIDDPPRLIRNSLTGPFGASPSLTVVPGPHPVVGAEFGGLRPTLFFPKE